MIIELKKGHNGPPTLSCIRADGTRTRGKLHPFFPVHDLTHAAVESVLGFNEAFFGLVAAGRLPMEARWAEGIVGVLDLERGTGAELARSRWR